MVQMQAVYEGGLHCRVTHGPSKSQIETDAPKDNMGRGERFSPTDLVGAALTTCILTTIAIVAERDGIRFSGASADFSKEMHPNPRRIAQIKIKIQMPSGLKPEERKKLEHIAHTCPVARSLHPDVQVPVEFAYPD